MMRQLDAFRETFCAEGFDACIVTANPDLRWLTGWDYTFDSEKAHVALITPDLAFLHTDARYSAVMRSRDTEGIWQINDERISHAACIARVLATLAKVKVGEPLSVFVENDLPLYQYRALEKALNDEAYPGLSKARLVESESLILKLRAIKNPDEIALLRRAQQITDTAFNKLLEWLRPGLTEIEVATELEYLMRTGGADSVAFPSIVASGPNSANPHAVPTTRALAPGDFVVIDFGARYQDYCADTTRTLCIGSPSMQQQEIYGAVLEAHNAAKAFIHPGITGAEAFECANDVLKSHGLSENFLHSLGHGLGLAVHELPRLATKENTPLVAGNVVSVEPGVYIPDYGGVRIEDCGLVTATGFESFTTLPHELMVI